MSTTTPPSVSIPDAPSLAAQMRPTLVKYFKRKTSSAVEAEDLAQEVIVRALTHTNWKSQAQARGYIFRTAVNLWRDRRCRLQVQGIVVEWNETTAAETGVFEAGDTRGFVIALQRYLPVSADYTDDDTVRLKAR